MKKLHKSPHLRKMKALQNMETAANYSLSVGMRINPANVDHKFLQMR